MIVVEPSHDSINSHEMRNGCVKKRQTLCVERIWGTEWEQGRGQRVELSTAASEVAGVGYAEVVVSNLSDDGLVDDG